MKYNYLLNPKKHNFVSNKVKIEKLHSNLVIYYFRNKYLQTTLWGSTALQIDDDLYQTYTKPFIVIVTSTIVKTFRGNYFSYNIKKSYNSYFIHYILFSTC